MEGMILQASKHPDLLIFANEQHLACGRGALIKIFSSSSEALSATSYEYCYVNEAVTRDIGSARINTLMHSYIPGREYLLLYGISMAGSGSKTDYDTVFSGCIMKSVTCAANAEIVAHPVKVMEHPGSLTGTCLRGVCTATALKWCFKCKDAKYCSRECQEMDWLSHKQNCEEAAKCRKAGRLMMRRMLS